MNNINKSRLINFFVVLAVILLLIFFNFNGLLTGFKSLVFFVASPFLKLFQAADNGISGAWGFFVTLKDLNKENADLRSANAMFSEEITRLKETARENEVLRQQLGIGQPEKQELIMAEVVGYNPTLGQYFLINRGQEHGLSVGLAVVVANNFLVGRVAEVSQDFSKVLLISDSNFLVNAVTQDTRISGVVKGSHGLGVAMEMIPIDVQVVVGETVLTSGLNEIIPGGMIIGRIADVAKKESEIWQRAAIASVVEFNRIEQVFILLP